MSSPSEELLHLAGVVCGLRAGLSVKEIAVNEIAAFFSFLAPTVYRLKQQYDEHTAAGGMAEDFAFRRKEYKRRSDATPRRCELQRRCDAATLLSKWPEKSMLASK